MSFVADFSPQSEPADDHWVVAVAAGKLLARKGADSLLQPHRNLSSFASVVDYHQYIGRWRGAPCFLSVYHRRALPSERQWELLDLRPLLGVLGEPEFRVIGQALQVAHWREYHQYCGRCGRATAPQSEERVLVCHRCQARFYPPVTPCVIGLVYRGDQCLLARNARFPEGLYSILAGFLEPGETVEQALEREVREEVGIEIQNVRYCTSQPWPFPSQLMLGFTASYHAGDLHVDGKEIVHADWFDAENLPVIPPEQTLSGYMIRDFCARVKRGRADVL